MASAYHLNRKLQKAALTELRETRLPQIGRVGGNVGIGKVFYVNGNRGSDSASGETPNNPFKTITYALTKCTDRNDDTILVTRDTTETAGYPVTVNKRDIHILGWDNPTRLAAEKIYFSSSSAECFSIEAQNVEIAGFDFVATSSYEAITFPTTGIWNCSIHDCNFGMRGALEDGINVPIGVDVPYLTVYDCYFGESCARDGIRIAGNATRGWLGLPGHGNIFRDVAYRGIHNLTSGAVLGGICDNVFRLVSDTAGYAINFAHSGASECMVYNNQAFYGTTALSANPYRDLGSNHWGLNYRQGVSILPATV